MSDNDIDTGVVQVGSYAVGDELVLHVTTSENYTSITFGELTFYFDREDGTYDGWGRDLEDNMAVQER